MTDANLIASSSASLALNLERTHSWWRDPKLTTHCGRPKDDKTKGEEEEEASSCMMKYKTTDSNLGSQCAVHHRDVHRIELGVLFHLIQGEARHGPARVGRVMRGKGNERKEGQGANAHMAVQNDAALGRRWLCCQILVGWSSKGRRGPEEPQAHIT